MHALPVHVEFIGKQYSFVSPKLWKLCHITLDGCTPNANRVYFADAHLLLTYRKTNEPTEEIAQCKPLFRSIVVYLTVVKVIDFQGNFADISTINGTKEYLFLISGYKFIKTLSTMRRL